MRIEEDSAPGGIVPWSTRCGFLLFQNKKTAAEGVRRIYMLFNTPCGCVDEDYRQSLKRGGGRIADHQANTCPVNAGGSKKPGEVEVTSVAKKRKKRKVYKMTLSRC